MLFPDEESYEWRIVKAADRISAYVKCLEEYGFGNREFLTAQEKHPRLRLADEHAEAEDFMREFAPSFMLPLDALKLKGGGYHVPQAEGARLRSNMELFHRKLIVYTWGNVSEVDREKGVMAIKPSGVPYEDLSRK